MIRLSDILKIRPLIEKYHEKYKDYPDIEDLLNYIEHDLTKACEQYDGLIELLEYIQCQSDANLLRILPICPGEICYMVDDSEGSIDRQLKVDHIEINENGMDIWLQEDDASSYSCYPASDFGTMLFSDYAEAQKRCDEIQSKLPPKVAE